MKKILALSLVLTIALSLCACGDTKSNTKAENVKDKDAVVEEVTSTEEYVTTEENNGVEAVGPETFITLEDAENSVGFSIAIPGELDGYTSVKTPTIMVIDNNTLEVGIEATPNVEGEAGEDVEPDVFYIRKQLLTDDTVNEQEETEISETEDIENEDPKTAASDASAEGDELEATEEPEDAETAEPDDSEELEGATEESADEDVLPEEAEEVFTVTSANNVPIGISGVYTEYENIVNVSADEIGFDLTIYGDADDKMFVATWIVDGYEYSIYAVNGTTTQFMTDLAKNIK